MAAILYESQVSLKSLDSAVIHIPHYYRKDSFQFTRNEPANMRYPIQSFSRDKPSDGEADVDPDDEHEFGSQLKQNVLQATQQSIVKSSHHSTSDDPFKRLREEEGLELLHNPDIAHVTASGMPTMA